MLRKVAAAASAKIDQVDAHMEDLDVSTEDPTIAPIASAFELLSVVLSQAARLMREEAELNGDEKAFKEAFPVINTLGILLHESIPIVKLLSMTNEMELSDEALDVLLLFNSSIQGTRRDHG